MTVESLIRGLAGWIYKEEAWGDSRGRHGGPAQNVLVHRVMIDNGAIGMSCGGTGGLYDFGSLEDVTGVSLHWKPGTVGNVFELDHITTVVLHHRHGSARFTRSTT